MCENNGTSSGPHSGFDLPPKELLRCYVRIAASRLYYARRPFLPPRFTGADVEVNASQFAGGGTSTAASDETRVPRRFQKSKPRSWSCESAQTGYLVVVWTKSYVQETEMTANTPEHKKEERKRCRFLESERMRESYMLTWLESYFSEAPYTHKLVTTNILGGMNVLSWAKNLKVEKYKSPKV